MNSKPSWHRGFRGGGIREKLGLISPNHMSITSFEVTYTDYSQHIRRAMNGEAVLLRWHSWFTYNIDLNYDIFYANLFSDFFPYT